MPAEPTADPSLPPSARRGTRRALLVITLAAIFAQVAALTGIQRLRGHVTAYAFQSPDAAEYVAVARGLAWTHRYIQLDSAGRQLTGPDTWRTPGYPLFLALVIGLANDSTRVLLFAQQLVAIASVPLLWLVLRRLTQPRYAFFASLAWCFDPFRLYYSLWLLSETLFTALLILTCWIWLEFTQQAGPANRSQIQNPKSQTSHALFLGLLAGCLVLVRPIALAIPLLVLVGVALAPGPSSLAPPFSSPQSAIRNPKYRVLATLACLCGITLTLGPWLIRNYIVAGHLALSQQSGASLAYHKVVDVALWSQGRARYRFDPAAAAEIRNDIDRRLRHEYLERFGHLTPAEADSLDWENLNFGRPLAETIDPFVVSGMLWSIGLDMLAGHLSAMFQCFTVQGAMMLIFPLGLVLWPPASTGSAPFSMLLGGQGRVAQFASALIGGAYAALALWILVRLIIAAIRRRIPPGFFALWPALAMLALSLPFEDPRFRLPLIPLFWILAVATSPRPSGPP